MNYLIWATLFFSFTLAPQSTKQPEVSRAQPERCVCVGNPFVQPLPKPAPPARPSAQRPTRFGYDLY